MFHQVDEEGAPLLDWGLIAEALNKADAGVPEKASPRPGPLAHGLLVPACVWGRLCDWEAGGKGAPSLVKWRRHGLYLGLR